MNRSRSFDRASQIYDQTRPLLEPIVTYGIPILLDAMGAGAHALEAGVGTGRISIPLLERGVDLIGCDLSSTMMKRFREKFPAARLARADASRLPFPNAHFEAVLTVHVLHLIPTWRDVLREFRRVLVPGGVYLNMRTWSPVGNPISEQIRTFWRGWMSANGVEVAPVGLRQDEELVAELTSLGAQFSEVEAARFPYTFHLGQQLERFATRSFSETWDIPDAIFEASIKELEAWMNHEYGDLDREVEDQVRCVIQMARFDLER